MTAKRVAHAAIVREIIFPKEVACHHHHLWQGNENLQRYLNYCRQDFILDVLTHTIRIGGRRGRRVTKIRKHVRCNPG
jgi:hypothetical protein